MNLDQGTLELIELHNFFAETRYGQALAKNIRYGRYKPAYWSNEKWERVLGPDVNNLKHLLHVLLSTKKFLETEKKFSPRDYSLFSLSAITHDWGEAIVGDVISDLKTDAEERRELIAFREVVSKVLGIYKKDYRKMITCLEEIVFCHCEPLDYNYDLHLVFKKTIEELIAENTALRAWRQAKKYPREASRLRWITLNVFVYLPNLLNNAEKFLSIRKFFSANKKTITEIFTAMPAETFEHYNYDPAEKTQKIAMFEKTKNLWLESRYAE